MSRAKFGSCALCGRTTSLTFHHLIPKKMHRRRRYAKRFSRDQLQQGIAICQRCHRGVHRLHDEQHLAGELFTLERLQADPSIARHVRWVAKQKS